MSRVNGVEQWAKVIRLGEPVLDIVFSANPAKDVCDGSVLGPLVGVDELNAVVGQHSVDLVGNRHQHGLKEARRHQLHCLPVDSGEDQKV